MENRSLYIVPVIATRGVAETFLTAGTPVGPYAPEDTEAMERGRVFLEDVYSPAETRTVQVYDCIAETARDAVQNQLIQEAKRAYDV